MRWRTLAALWNRFFFKPQSPAALGLYRILFGLLVIAKLLLFAPEWQAWFGEHAWVTLQTMHHMESGTRIDLFDILPPGDGPVWAFFALTMLAAFCLTVGFWTRLSSVLVFFALTSIDERELYAMNSGDTFLRVTAFFLMFAPAGAAFSVDRLVRIWNGTDTPEQKPQVIWAQRMIQYLTALVYVMTAWWKSTGSTWVDGTAIYYVQHLLEFQRFPLPSWFLDPIMVKIQTWTGLVEEFALGTLIWIREARYWVLGGGVLLHLALEYSMNVPLFQWIMLSAFVLFIDAPDLQRFWGLVAKRVSPFLGPSLEFVYNKADFQLRRRANLLYALDIFRKIDFVPERTGDWHVRLGNRDVRGAEAVRRIAAVAPIFWVLGPMLLANFDKKSGTPAQLTK